MGYRRKSTGPVSLIFIFFIFSSCNARIQGVLDTGGGGEFTVSTALEPRMSTLIRSLSKAGGGRPSPDAPVLDGAAIARSMEQAPGMAAVSLRNTGPAAIDGLVTISRLGDFLAPAGGSGFISLEQPGPEGRGGRLSINLHRESGPEMLALLSPEVSDYLSALMAPLSTGEVLTRAEYLDLVASVYGRAVADEIAGGRIRVSVDFPGPVGGIRGGTFSGKRAEFDLSLPDLLVLEQPLNYEVVWK
ncbi:MAG: hypothetical protein LBP23_05680 [Treponema sp.]|jgi:hypothetical protein|nr:hypothetical protein [Treponema sp.]